MQAHQYPLYDHLVSMPKTNYDINKMSQIISKFNVEHTEELLAIIYHHSLVSPTDKFPDTRKGMANSLMLDCSKMSEQLLTIINNYIIHYSK